MGNVVTVVEVFLQLYLFYVHVHGFTFLLLGQTVKKKKITTCIFLCYVRSYTSPSICTMTPLLVS